MATETPPSWSQSAHLSCLNCHIQVNASDRDDALQAPVSCQGCHGQDLEPAQTTERTPPRFNRGQPDAAFISPSPADIEAMTSGNSVQKASMQPVPFDHKAHEQATDTCRACHHESSLKPCSQCHGRQGSEQGGMISLDQAMHSLDSKLSCVGCHWQKTQDLPQCAGCHTLQKKAAAGQEDNCLVCHDPRGPEYKELLDMPLQDQARRAKEL
ncbi:MAG: cytochrome c3 family protein, partial [Desulfovermiculus sp.]